MFEPTNQLILKVTDTCNLNCSYCYYYTPAVNDHFSTKRTIKWETVKQLFASIREHCEKYELDEFNILFHGGEPLLAGLSFYERVFALAKAEIPPEVKIRWAITTNATLFTLPLIRLFKSEAVNITVSLDGPKEAQDKFRVDHHGRGSFERVMKNLSLVREENVEINILSVINPDQRGDEMYAFFRSIGVRWMNFLLPDYSYDTFPHSDVQGYNNRCFDFMKSAFDAWFSENNPDITVGYFVDAIRVMLGEAPDLCTMQRACPSFVTVESDGRLSNCDVTRLCGEGNYTTGLTVADPIDPIKLNPLHKNITDAAGLCAECLACELLFACGGHCPGTRFSSAKGLNNVSIFCGFFKKFLPYVRQRVEDSLPESARRKLLEPARAHVSSCHV